MYKTLVILIDMEKDNDKEFIEILQSMYGKAKELGIPLNTECLESEINKVHKDVVAYSLEECINGEI